MCNVFCVVGRLSLSLLHDELFLRGPLDAGQARRREREEKEEEREHILEIPSTFIVAVCTAGSFCVTRLFPGLSDRSD